MAEPGPTFPHERFVTRVPDEDVHLEAQVVGWVASGWLRVGDPGVHNLNVLHVALVKLIHELWEPLELDWVVSEVLELVPCQEVWSLTQFCLLCLEFILTAKYSLTVSCETSLEPIAHKTDNIKEKKFTQKVFKSTAFRC